MLGLYKKYDEQRCLSWGGGEGIDGIMIIIVVVVDVSNNNVVVACCCCCYMIFIMLTI